MLDPKEQKKGGFGAFAQRDRERRDADALKNAAPTDAMPGTSDKPITPPSSDSTTRNDATRGSSG